MNRQVLYSTSQPDAKDYDGFQFPWLDGARAVFSSSQARLGMVFPMALPVHPWGRVRLTASRSPPTILL